MEAAREKLEKAYIDMQKASKLTGKVLQDVEQAASKSSRLVSTATELGSLHETLESMMSDLGFVLKFNKTRDGQAVTPQVAQSVLKMCAKVLQDVLDVTKQTKSLLPEKKPEVKGRK